MPLIWKRLIVRYLKTTLLCSSGLTLMLIVASLQEIATFIAKDVPLRSIIKMTAYQIPYLLPWIIPIACFISGFQLFKSLSNNNQMTFLRASGASNFVIIFPILACSALIGLFNFYSCSELASVCRFKACSEIAEIIISSPSFLLQTLQKSEDGKFFITSEGYTKGDFKNIILAYRKEKFISDICLIKNASVDIQNDQFRATNVTVLSTLPMSLDESDFSNTLVENIKEIIIPKITSGLLKDRNFSKTRIDYMTFQELLRKMTSDSQESPLKSYILEIIRRFAVGTLCISLTFAGIVLGIEKPRFKKHNKAFYILPVVTLLLLILGKNNTTQLTIGICFFIVPQLLLLIIFYNLSLREKKGICR